MEDVKVNIQSAAMFYINKNIENIKDTLETAQLTSAVKVEDVGAISPENARLNLMA